MITYFVNANSECETRPRQDFRMWDQARPRPRRDWIVKNISRPRPRLMINVQRKREQDRDWTWFKILHETETRPRVSYTSVSRPRRDWDSRQSVGPWRALLVQGSSEISLAGSILGSMKVQEGPLSPDRVPQWPKKCSKMVRGAR